MTADKILLCKSQE